MSTRKFHLRATVGAGLLALLSACGGGNDPVVVGGSGTPGTGGGTATPQQAFLADYGNGLAALNTTAGLTNAAFVELFDDAFLDAGYDKAQVRSNLSQEAAARATTPGLVFPNATLSNASIGACDANNICTMTATLTNADADTTAVTFTTKVRLSNGKVRLYGDQTAAST